MAARTWSGNCGFPASKDRVERLMQKNGIKAKHKRRFKVTTDSKHNLPIAPNLLERNFAPEAPNQAWTSDISVPQQAASEMRVGPTQSSCRSRLQTLRRRKTGGRSRVSAILAKSYQTICDGIIVVLQVGKFQIVFLCKSSN